jgi:hypothetical protein
LQPFKSLYGSYFGCSIQPFAAYLLLPMPAILTPKPAHLPCMILE